MTQTQEVSHRIGNREKLKQDRKTKLNTEPR